MLVVRLNGGLGNQMFQYASSLAVAKANNLELGLDVSVFSNQPQCDTQRFFELNKFNIDTPIVGPRQFSFFSSKSLFNRFLRSRWERSFRSIHEIEGFAFDPTLFERAAGGGLMNGYWQSFRYFDSIRLEIEKRFSPSAQVNQRNQFLIDEACQAPTLSVHVRRGDYISNPVAHSFHGVMDVEYYSRAIDLVRASTEVRKVFVFSDDLDWCKNNLKLPWPVEYVWHNQGSHSYWDIHLMRFCVAHIIANSSFSWWGAWLAGERSKVVIAPAQWTKSMEAGPDLIPSSWIRL